MSLTHTLGILSLFAMKITQAKAYRYRAELLRSTSNRINTN